MARTASEPFFPAVRALKASTQVYGPGDPIPFAREVWPTLKIGTRIIVEEFSTSPKPRQYEGVISDISATAVQLRVEGGKAIYRFDDLAVIFWHPKETGEGLTNVD